MIEKTLDSMHDHTVLVVEDERPLLEIIKKKLEQNNCEVVTARSVEQALEYLEEIDTISAVWLDHYLLGKEDGMVLVAKLKSDNSAWRKVPIFVVSNTASQEKVQAYMSLGVDQYFVKAESKLAEIASEVVEAIKKSEQ